MTKPSRAMSRCSSAKPFGGSAEPSGVCSVARRSAAPRLRGGRPAQRWFEVANAQSGQGGLHSVGDARAFPDQALALPIGPYRNVPKLGHVAVSRQQRLYLLILATKHQLARKFWSVAANVHKQGELFL